MKWIDDLTVGRKLFVAFATVLAAIAVMGVVVGVNLMALTRAGEQRSLENKVNRATAAAEFYMARQENSFRGYLVTRFGIDEVGTAESGDNGLGALVPYRLDFCRTPA